MRCTLSSSVLPLLCFGLLALWSGLCQSWGKGWKKVNFGEQRIPWLTLVFVMAKLFLLIGESQEWRCSTYCLKCRTWKSLLQQSRSIASEEVHRSASLCEHLVDLCPIYSFLACPHIQPWSDVTRTPCLEPRSWPGKMSIPRQLSVMNAAMSNEELGLTSDFFNSELFVQFQTAFHVLNWDCCT